MTDASLRGGEPTRRWSWTDPKVRSLVLQVLLGLFLIWMAWSIIANAQANLARQGIASGFGFLDNSAGFGITQTLIPYGESDSYGRAFLVGLLNTLLVAVLGIILSTIIGFLMGVARLSNNVVIKGLSTAYVEITRNLPPLFQIMFWYIAVLAALPGPRQSIGFGLQPLLNVLGDGLNAVGLASVGTSLKALAGGVSAPGVFLNNRGLVIPRAIFGEGAQFVFWAFVVALVLVFVLGRWAKRRREATGQQFPVFWTSLALLIGLPFLTGAALGFPVTFEKPELRGFNFAGGVRVIPELVSLLLALSIYTAGFIAETVRSGILAVSKGQTEAAHSLGLKGGLTMRLVVIPQAMRVIIPQLTSQYLNLTKNSTLGVAVGYPDLFSVFAGTTLNQTGQAIEIIAITMAVYLTISVVTTLIMDWYNRRVALIER
ncbi:amino acid ABC transporter permease protein precursor [Azorhizobium caulinodans ORS 571]|uniref:Amino acid ABC transporter permease protein n=1 Tax=Azorhizobium caulinodans (strain ATCC 43989 / DSM 5975 / JCM 20966 / LMG 6465 / NBRC 14845 / NCIMB 13405 / ORS 571) TaxID=438753 RepID=A8HY80_AZOC5|nr:amino acid ABC transporter permease [Azorhizobium caulinodans]BAF87584.1 amino acid ABC transporter permease protein precursor [Azorhizobium caulinodans ORS 571]